jgi:plastocyanin
MTGEERNTPRPRESLLWPVVIPLGVLVVIGLVLWGFSRVLLHVKPHVATATALVTAIGIVVIVSIAASRKRVGNGSLLSVGVGVIGVAMLASGAALLLGSEEEEAGPGVTIALVAPAGAAADGFQQKTLSVPSDESFTIEFDNQDTSVQHNVVIAESKDPNAATFLTGTAVIGPAQVADPVSPLAEGDYYFYCQFHPTTMNGTLTAAPGVGGEGGGPPQLSTSISAAGLAFDTTTLTFAANEKSQLEFQNNDTAPHDIAIYTDSSATDELFEGEIVDPGTSQTYEIPALDPGSYFFHCTIHTQMMGTVNVVEAPPAEGGGGGGGGGPPPSGAPPPSGSVSPSG